jgi:hypothetical protein
MQITQNLESRRTLRHLDPRVLDDIARIASLKAIRDPHDELAFLNGTLIRHLGEVRLVSSVDLQDQLKIAYERAELLAMPSAVGYRGLCHRLLGVTSSFHLQSMGIDQMRVLDELALNDAAAATLHRELLLKLQIATQATDAELTRKLAQLFETFSEFWVYRRLRECVTITKIAEGDDPSPDFQCALGGRDFFIEVKAPDIVGGDLHHAQLMKEATEAAIELDNQVRAGRRVASVASSITPFSKVGDQNHDAEDLTPAISTIRERARTLFTTRQFSHGPTFALMFLERFAVPSNRRSILPDYKVGGMWTALPDDRQSGVLWQAAFGLAGSTIHNLNTPKRTLTGTPFLLDSGSPFPGLGLLAVSEIHSGSSVGTTECWGLINPYAPAAGNWQAADTVAVLNALCDVWNDKDDSRPKWQDS